MSILKELKDEVETIFREKWEETTAVDVPAPEDIALGNRAKLLDSATVLYADLDGSTRMVDRKPWGFSAEVYKTFLRCTARLIRDDEGAAITAYDGDRIMAIFVGDSKNTRAVRCALKINYAVEVVIQSALKNVYTSSDFVVEHVVLRDPLI